MKKIFLTILLFSISSIAQTQFQIPTKDGLSVLNGQFDLPQAHCGEGPFPTILIVSGTGFSYRDGLTVLPLQGDRSYIYKYLGQQFAEKCWLTVRWDYRGVSCDSSPGNEAKRCVDEEARKLMTYESMLEDIESIYKYSKAHPSVSANNFVILGHSEGSLNVSKLISEKRLNPKGVLYIGGVTESPKSIFHWQIVTRPAEWLFELDVNRDDILTNEEIKSEYSKSKFASLKYPIEVFLSPKGSWSKQEYLDKSELEFNQYKEIELAKDDNDHFRMGKHIYSKQSYWKMWFTNDVSVLDLLSDYSGKIIYINGDIDSQVPGVRERDFLLNFNKPMLNQPVFKVPKGIGHSLGSHNYFGPIEDDMVLEVESSIFELMK